MADIWLLVFWYLYAMHFPGIGPLYHLPMWLKKNWTIFVDLCEIMCAQVYFHKTVDIKSGMDGTNGENAM